MVRRRIKHFKKYYSIIPKEEFLKLLPTRSENAIVCKAMQLKIKSYNYLQEKYSEDERQFIIDNFGILTDDEIAQKLNKTSRGIRDQRARLGLCYANKEYAKYENLQKLFRGHLQNWKK